VLDIAIRGGTVIDGTGAPGRSADVGLRGGRIAAIGELREDAEHVVDAAGRIVAPGFVDVHTHYDAQIFWDPTLSPSLYHGVTSIAGGNCGFSIAPLSDAAGEYLMRMLARVEGMPLESLETGVPWDWRSFGEYLDKLEGRIAINAGFLVGHSALRSVVMGERAVGNEATPEELRAMVELLRRSLAEGGLGFSSSRAITHNDGNGEPVPSRHAHRDELVALARAVRDFPGTTLELLPGVGRFGDEAVELLIDLSLAARRPINWNLLAPSSAEPDLPEAQLGASDRAQVRGARIVGLTVPQAIKARVNFTSGFALDTMPDWPELFGLPLPERKRALQDPSCREKLRKGSERVGEGLRPVADFDNMTIEETFEPANKSLEGRTLGEVARERGTTAFDQLLDLAV